MIRKFVYVSYIVQAITVVVNFIYSLVLVHQLGSDGYGEYALFFNSLAFAVLLFGFNLPSITVFFIANRRIDPGKLLFSSLLFTFLTTLLLALLLIQSDRWNLSIHIFPGAHSKPLWIFFFAAQFLFMQVNQVLAAYLNANKVFISIGVFAMLGNILVLVFWILVVLHVIDLKASSFDTIWWVSLIVSFCISIYSVYVIRRRAIPSSFWKLISVADLRMLAGFAVIVYLCNTIQFLNYKMDIWFVNYFRTGEETGVYALALSLSQLIWILPNAISAVLLNYFRVQERESSIRLATQYARVTVWFAFLSAIGLSAVYYLALPRLYGPEFQNTFTLCIILFIGTIPFSLSIIIANLNSGIGFIRINLYATIFTFILGFILDIVLIPEYGIKGAAIAKMIIYVSGLIFQIIVGRVLYKLRWMEMFRFPSLKKSKTEKIDVSNDIR